MLFNRKTHKLFKNQIQGKLVFSITKNLNNSLNKISKDIQLETHGEKNILLSPAAASFDQFSNFENRGVIFKRLCKKYARKFY